MSVTWKYVGKGTGLGRDPEKPWICEDCKQILATEN